MTMTGNTEGSIKRTTPSYLEIVVFIENYGIDIEKTYNNYCDVSFSISQYQTQMIICAIMVLF